MDTPGMPTSNPTPSATPPSASSGSGKKILIIVLVVVLGLGLLSMIGSFIAAKAIGFGLKKAIEAGGVKIDEQSGGITISGKDGGSLKFTNEGTMQFTDESGNTSSVTTANEIPADFPSDFPVPSGLTVQSRAVTDAPEGKLYIVSWTAGDVGAATDFLAQQLPARGWKIDQRIDAGGGTMFYFTRANGNEDGGWVTVGQGDTQNEVALWLLIKK